MRRRLHQQGWEAETRRDVPKHAAHYGEQHSLADGLRASTPGKKAADHIKLFADSTLYLKHTGTSPESRPEQTSRKKTSRKNTSSMTGACDGYNGIRTSSTSVGATTCCAQMQSFAGDYARQVWLEGIRLKVHVHFMNLEKWSRPSTYLVISYVVQSCLFDIKNSVTQINRERLSFIVP